MHDPLPLIIGGGVTIIAVVWLVIILLGIFASIFWIIELIDVVRREFPDPNMKIIWVVVILLSHVVGAIVYYFAGRPLGTLPPNSNQNRF